MRTMQRLVFVCAALVMWSSISYGFPQLQSAAECPKEVKEALGVSNEVVLNKALVAALTSQSYLTANARVICVNMKMSPPIPLTKSLQITSATDLPLIVYGLQVDAAQLTEGVPVISIAGAQPVVLQNLTLKNAKQGIQIQGDGHAMVGSVLEGSRIAQSIGIDALSASHVTVRETTVRNFGVGVQMGGAESTIGPQTKVVWDYLASATEENRHGVTGIRLEGNSHLIRDSLIGGYATGGAISGEKHAIRMSSIIGYPMETVLGANGTAQEFAVTAAAKPYHSAIGLEISGVDHHIGQVTSGTGNGTTSSVPLGTNDRVMIMGSGKAVQITGAIAIHGVTIREANVVLSITSAGADLSLDDYIIEDAVYMYQFGSETSIGAMNKAPFLQCMPSGTGENSALIDCTEITESIVHQQLYVERVVLPIAAQSCGLQNVQATLTAMFAANAAHQSVGSCMVHTFSSNSDHIVGALNGVIPIGDGTCVLDCHVDSSKLLVSAIGSLAWVMQYQGNAFPFLKVPRRCAACTPTVDPIAPVVGVQMEAATTALPDTPDSESAKEEGSLLTASIGGDATSDTVNSLIEDVPSLAAPVIEAPIVDTTEIGTGSSPARSAAGVLSGDASGEMGGGAGGAKVGGCSLLLPQ